MFFLYGGSNFTFLQPCHDGSYTRDANFVGIQTEVPKWHSVAFTLGAPHLDCTHKFSALSLRPYKIAGHFHDVAGRRTSGKIEGMLEIWKTNTTN